MRFGIDVISIWSRKGVRRDVEFKRNCVNVITGGSQTGKTALLRIIDYCFLASEHKLPHDVINDNTDWYGLKFYINDKEFVLARRSPHEAHVSNDYFFSSMGEFPALPSANSSEADIRSILEAEFGIDDRVVLPFGGRALKSGSKVSFRYFFLFNTVSEDIIINTTTFFDRQDEERYREALPRIFDLALGIDDLSNIAARERKEQLRKEIAKAERRSSSLNTRSGIFDGEARKIASQAAAYGLIKEAPADVSAASLRDVIKDVTAPSMDATAQRYSEVNAQLFATNRRIRKLQQFTEEHKAYKTTLKVSEDSLKPLQVLMGRSADLVKSEIFDDLMSGLKADLSRVKEAVAPRRPVDGQVTSLLRKLESDKSALEEQLEALPKMPKSFDSLRDMWLFIGEARGKLDAYADAEPETSTVAGSDVSDLMRKMEEIDVRNVEEARDAVVYLINEVAMGLVGEASSALENYGNWQAIFSYRDKRLQLRKPRSTLIENVGSSSNHMFLHLFQFLALHEVAINKKSVFVPAFLVLDQPSRPYYGEEDVVDPEEVDHSDRAKIKAAFEMLNNFVARINRDYGAEFQMIVLEHIPASLLAGMKNIHLVEQFRDGNALIPASWRSHE
ncbi:Protein of unknown function [Collimonas sp. OK307]|uniref:DUF3732 domain-containing protein n=1 Tax=Collimonas sp. OK307 TaxID=1801620 RepID=UPI0008EEB3BD|nr:DUF3732 domain-containing protein [Collimonas sp. OK307]SFI22266.1 Protein of unknown function [Collimonas sp. OK307]